MKKEIVDILHYIRNKIEAPSFHLSERGWIVALRLLPRPRRSTIYAGQTIRKLDWAHGEGCVRVSAAFPTLKRVDPNVANPRVILRRTVLYKYPKLKNRERCVHRYQTRIYRPRVQACTWSLSKYSILAHGFHDSSLPLFSENHGSSRLNVHFFPMIPTEPHLRIWQFSFPGSCNIALLYDWPEECLENCSRSPLFIFLRIVESRPIIVS